jgi:membrane protein DedA with SNARE-associated domain
MHQTTQFLVAHGPLLVFASVFLDQMGVPLPAVPWLLAAGALSAAGKFSLLLWLGINMLACLIADLIWFYLGRHRGHRVLGLLCRISLEPDSCVRRTQNMYTRYGLRGVVMAKFLPGLSENARTTRADQALEGRQKSKGCFRENGLCCAVRCSATPTRR